MAMNDEQGARNYLAMISFDPADYSPRERYQKILPCVAPRPIAFVSSISAESIPNLAPFSFFNMGGGNPPSLVFSPTTNRESQHKDTVLNIEETGEYVISVVTRDMAEKVNLASFEYPRGVSEWEKAGFTPLPATKVKASLVKESPVNFEMKLFQIVRHGDGPIAANYVIGEVVMCHMDERILTEGVADSAKLDLVGRLGQSWYSMTRPDDLFSLPRPSAPVD